jgi:glycosyltransferase involved in cell wall biosynthesis
MKPAVSVIVPVYKVEQYLDKCVQSILDQTFRDFELLLVDDGSPDKCGEMCETWAKKDGRIRVIHKPNGGLSDARNAGIGQASGDYLLFVDSDDWIEKDMLATLYGLIREADADMACCNFRSVNEDGSQHWDDAVITPGVWTEEDFWKQFFSSNAQTYCNVAWNKLYKKELFDTVRYPVGRINEDVYILYDLVSQCKKIAATDQIGYYYLFRAGSIMNRSGSLRKLTNPEAYINRARAFADRQLWYFSEESLMCAVHNMLLGDFGEGGKKSKEYRAVKREAKTVFSRLFRRMSLKRKISLSLFFISEPLARGFRKAFLMGRS